jgi:glycosyltransferase involved in cell wall biosynthesis
MPKVSVVLNVYKRAEHFEMQIESLLRQSIAPFEILVWENGNERVPDKYRDKVTVARAETNFGVWARFSYALNAKGDYVLVLDDDTVPGRRWIENCLNTMFLSPGLLGTRGLLFATKHSYAGYSEVGVYAPNETIQRADIVGHAWFFKREWLGAFWGEYANRFPEDLSGEDIHFSYAMQKVVGLNTFVPPHPVDDEELWGSKPSIARTLGTDGAAISSSRGALAKFERALRHYVSLGFQISPKSTSSSDYKSSFSPFLTFLMGRMPLVTSKLSGSRFGQLLRRFFSGDKRR